jgi:hypothetical protein
VLPTSAAQARVVQHAREQLAHARCVEPFDGFEAPVLLDHGQQVFEIVGRGRLDADGL